MGSGALGFSQVGIWHQNAHKRIVESFESSVSPEIYGFWNAKNPLSQVGTWRQKRILDP